MSRFVSAGTAEDEAAAPGSERDEAWEKAQQQIEAARSATGAQKPRPGEQEGGKSLYETLQANKGDYPVPLFPPHCDYGDVLEVRGMQKADESGTWSRETGSL